MKTLSIKVWSSLDILDDIFRAVTEEGLFIFDEDYDGVLYGMMPQVGLYCASEKLAIGKQIKPLIPLITQLYSLVGPTVFIDTCDKVFRKSFPNNITKHTNFGKLYQKELQDIIKILSKY